VRVGSKCDGPRAPYDYAFLVVSFLWWAKIKALIGTGGTTEHYVAGLEALERLGFWKFTNERNGKGPQSFVLTRGPNGELSMKKNHPRHEKLKHVPHTDEAKNDDGTINLPAAEGAIPTFVAAIKAGNPVIEDISQTDPGPDGIYYVIYRMRAK